ncbi:MAG: flagellar protein [Clostridia bacterium]|nr:flagellar protein [Clostridia bacterium]
MSEKIFFSQPLQPLTPKHIQNKEKLTGERKPFTQNFQEILEKQIQNSTIKFSKHAQERLNLRNIKLDEKNMEKLTTAVQKARAKGAKESLILMDDLALVVSIKNNTVITAMDGPHIKENVFTNIDSAVII